MKLLLTTLFLSGVLSAPFTKRKSSKCDNGASRFHSRKTMIYDYEGETLSGLAGTSDVRSGLKLRAKCEISPVTPCVYMLKVTQAELLEAQGKTTNSLVYQASRGSWELRRELLAYELYFENNRGMIRNIRSDTGEPTHILNIKRGILSAFQLKMINKDETITEVDINGECKAKYQVKYYPSGQVKTIIKSKNLSLCDDRSKTNLGIPVTNYPTDKPFSFLSSNSLCRSVLSKKSKLGKVHCEETHLFRPFSSGYSNSSGAMTTVRQTLKLSKHKVVSMDGISLSGKVESSLRYEHSQTQEKTTKNDREVKEILEKLAAEEGAKPDSARLFSKLIFAMRRLRMKAMTSIWYYYYECEERGRCTKEQAEKYQKYIVDAFSHCGTLDCAQFMVSAISDKKVGTQQSISFLTGIALVGKPSEDMVGNILYLCQDTPSRTAFLTLGTLINKYCRHHDCDKLNPRSSIYQADIFLQSKLRKNCNSTSPEDVDMITLVLKAIGNAGRPLSAVTNLLKCAVEPASAVIKIEALQALRRIPCSTEMTEGLLDIFKAISTDTEIRIETYLALMRCPTELLINKIADILHDEKNNQVGSFVWSHLTNARQSTEPVYGIPLRDVISKALAGRTLRSYNLDRLRYSRAYETSYYNKKREVGGSSQAQVIFHPDSFFPRSAKFNLTVDLLGASINLLEMAARFEGFEPLIEQMFGSEGYFPDERLMKMLKIKSTSFGNNARESRSPKEDEMGEIKSNLEKLQDKMKIERKNPSGALSFKVFGHELQFLSFDDIDWLQGEADKINVIDTLINIARGGKYTFTKSFMFLEADHEVPTGLGLPLKLSVNGSAVTSLNLKGKFDIRNMFWGKKKFDVRGYVTPSAVIDISGKMTVDATHASSGILVNTSLYTATEINANATYKEDEGIKLSIDPPRKPIYIINVTSNLATFLDKKLEKISGSSKRIQRQACMNFTKILGVNLCGHISAPLAFRDYNAPYFPLSGESSLGMSFQTTNADLARFELEGRKLTSNDDNRHDWIFNVHIPGLTFGKRMESNCTFQFLKNGKYLSVSSGIHGYKFGRFEAKYNNNTNGLYTKFSTPELAYLKPVTIESEIFNNTNLKTNEQDIGISINATYKTFTIQEVITLFKHNDQYGFKSNFTYWPQKHITTEGRLSVLKRSVFLKMDDTNSKSKLFFKGKLGKSTNKFHVQIGNDIMNYEVKLDGEVNVKNREIMMDMFTKPSMNLLKFRLHPRENAIERGFYMKLLHVNSSSRFTGYLGASHTETESSLKFNGYAMNKPFSIRATRYSIDRERKVELVASGFDHSASTSLGVASKSGSLALNYHASLDDKKMKSSIVLFKNISEMGLNWNAAFMDETVDVFAGYSREDQNRGLRLRLMRGDRTFDTRATYFTGKKEKGLKFTMAGMGRSGSLIWAYYNSKTEAGLRMKASGVDKSIEITTGVFTVDNERGLRVSANVFDKKMEARWSILSGSAVGVKFVASALKKNIEIKSTFSNYDDTTEWRVDTIYDGKTRSLVSTYVSVPNEKLLCSELADSRKVHFRVCTNLIKTTGEKAIRLYVEGFGRKAEVRADFIHTDNEKGGRLQMKYDAVPVSDIFVGLVTSSKYNGLLLRGNIYDQSVNALLKYKKTGSKRSVNLELRINDNMVSFKSIWVREKSLQGVQVNVMHQNQAVGSAYTLLVRKSGAKVLKIGVKSARKNGVEYKLALGNSRIEKKLASTVTVTANGNHYKYGWSMFYTNKGTSEEPNHMVTSKLHYGRDKLLTSVYQMINTEQSFTLLSKKELLPGRFVTNRFAISKPSGELFIQSELIPGVRMTYSADLERSDQLLGLRSTLTILDHPMNSSIIFDKKTGRLTCTFAFSRTLPPVEMTSHLRTKNDIDMGFSLSAFNMTWAHKFLLDYSSKQMELAINVLPNIPVEMIAKIFDNNQFILNITTCSAFSVQLAGKKPTRNDYHLIFKHQYLNRVFEDLTLNLNSFHDLTKLQLKWDSKMAMELFTAMNDSLRNLFSKKMDIAKMSRDLVKYMKEDGRDFVMRAINNGKELLKGDYINTAVKTYRRRVTEMANEVKENMLKLMDEMKTYGYPLMETYTQLEIKLNAIASELSPHLKTFSTDIRLWLWRSFDRYRLISVYGTTVEGICWNVLEKTRMYYITFVQKCKRQLTSNVNVVKMALREFNQVTKKMKITVEEFTCDYDMECAVRNVRSTFKKLMNSAEMMKINKLLEKISGKVVDQYKTMQKLVLPIEKISEKVVRQYKIMEKLVSTSFENSKLQEKTREVLRVIKEILESMATSIKANTRPLQERVEEIYKYMDERVQLLKQLSLHDRLVVVRYQFKIYYERFRQQVEHVTLKEVGDKLKMLVEKISKFLRDQENQLLEKIRSVNLREMMGETRNASARIYREIVDDLKRRGTELYPKLLRQLKNILQKVKKSMQEYVELVKSRITELHREQGERLTKTVEKVKTIMRETMIGYKDQLTLLYEKRYKDVLDVVTLYKDMPIEEILKDLRTKMRRMVDNAMATIMEETLSAYQTTSTYAKKVYYQSNLEVRWKRILDITRDIQIKFQAVTEKQFKPLIKNHLAEIEKMIVKHTAEIETMAVRVRSYLKIRSNEAKLYYDEVKHMKFKEMYDKARKFLQVWVKKMKKCPEACLAKVEEWRTKITKFMKEVNVESINVATSVKKVNEQVQQDAVETFRPYKVLVKNTFNNHMGLISKTITELRQRYAKTLAFMNEYRNVVEDYTTAAVEKLRNFDKKEVDTMLASLIRNPFMAKVYKYLNRSTFFVEVMDRGFVVASQECIKPLAKKLRKLCDSYLLVGKSFLDNTRDELYSRIERTRKDIEYVSEMSLYDVQIRVTKTLKMKLLAPAKSTYKNISDFVERQLHVLAEKRIVLKDRADELLRRFRVMVADSKQWMMRSHEWTIRKWNSCKPNVDEIVRLSRRLRSEAEMLTIKTAHMCKKYVDEHINDFLTMTPNELIQYAKQTYNKSYDLAQRTFETMKTTTVHHLRVSLRAMAKFIDEIDTDAMLRQAKSKTEVGTRLIRSIVQDVGEQVHFISTEIIQTVLFFNRFYIIQETVYSRHPSNSRMIVRLNAVVDKVIELLANVTRNVDNISTKVMEMLNNMKDIGRKQYEDIVVFVKKLHEKYPSITKYANVGITSDLPMTLVSDAIECMRKVGTSLRHHVTVNLDYCKKNMDNVMQVIRRTQLDLASGKLKPLDVTYKIGSNMKTAMKKQYVTAALMMRKMTDEVYPKFIVYCKETLKMANEILRRLPDDAMTKWQDIKLEVTSFRQSIEKTWTPVRTSITKNLKDINRMRKETLDVCTTIAISYYNKGMEIIDAVREVNIPLTIANYTKTLSEEYAGLVNDMKSRVLEMVRKIRTLRGQVIDKTWRMNMKKKIMNWVYESSNITQFYNKSKRLFKVTMDNGEFTLYLIKYTIKYSDFWDIARKLADPFYWLPPSNSVAMIFGTPHVYTFDGKYYEFPGYKKPSCTYVLAHDFRDKNFTLMSTETSLILSTKSGHITIDGSGTVEATVSKDAEGKDVKVVYKELPVEMMHVTVKREGTFVKINHDQGLDVTCDLKHFLCTFNVDGFYHGKLAGLLGTNNNELYDEFMTPDKVVAKSAIDFANAWEVSGDPECKFRNVAESKKSPCRMEGSPRCKELFLDKTSPLAAYFNKLNPKPFYKACVYDTSDCQADMTKTRSPLSYCNVTAAYTALLREKGTWARQLSECASCGSMKMWQKWTQQGSKSVDVVLLVPETLNIQSHSVYLPTFLQELEDDLGKYNPRYAVVAFGGKSGVHQHPHIVTSGSNIFGKMQDVNKAIQNMKFTNGKADALDATEYIQRLPFNPGATKIVILLTDQIRDANSTSIVNRTIKSLNMHGIIFNVIGPYFQKKQHRNVLGLSQNEVYLKTDKRQHKFHSIGLPSDDYIRIAQSTHGGIFNLKAYSRSHGEWNNLLATAVKTTLIKQIDNDQTYCRQCVCVPSVTTEPVTICRINRYSRC